MTEFLERRGPGSVLNTLNPVDLALIDTQGYIRKLSKSMGLQSFMYRRRRDRAR